MLVIWYASSQSHVACGYTCTDIETVWTVDNKRHYTKSSMKSALNKKWPVVFSLIKHTVTLNVIWAIIYWICSYIKHWTKFAFAVYFAMNTKPTFVD